MEKRYVVLDCEGGFVLVASLLVLMILVIVGIASLDTTSIELQIATNEKVHNETFYAAESGTEVAVEVLTRNLEEGVGFNKTDTIDSVDVADLDAVIRVFERNGNSLSPAFLNSYPTLALVCGDLDDLDADGVLDNPDHDIAFPINNLGSGEQETYLYAGGQTRMGLGSSLQMAAGYEGKGKSAIGGASEKVYDIFSRHEGRMNSRSIIMLGWRTVYR